ncbi:DegT/DnrJ/EryC1/StrS family aminotransferase [Flexivirga alba]|uniref:DegT/DnrJ/EryC1/StrS family aminotransferase n=1 Tax=Flexivirga alba TaxID=702742 RepID=A0ABW2AFR4_9MICO
MTSTEFLPFAVPDIGEAEIGAVVEAMRSGWLTTGPNAAAFEAEFARVIGEGTHCIAVNSATAGLHLALDAIGIGPGDEVLVPTWTFTSTAEVVRYVGADPVFVDVDKDSLNIDLRHASARVTPRTRAIMPVHFAGRAVDRGQLAAFAKAHDLAVIEDAAHAFPVRSQGRMVGSGDSDAVVFSFYATKTITTGEGGMIAIADPDRARRIRAMRLHGISRDVFDRYRSTKPSWEYEVIAPGFKYNLTDTAAAMGRVQLARADQMRDRRQHIAASYSDAFSDLPVDLPVGPLPGDTHGWHLYVLRLQDDAGLSRNEFIQRMAELGVGCSVHFIPLHRQPYWRDRYHLLDNEFPVASSEFERCVSLPAFSSMTTEQIDRVISAVQKCLR